MNPRNPKEFKAAELVAKGYRDREKVMKLADETLSPAQILKDLVEFTNFLKEKAQNGKEITLTELTDRGYDQYLSALFNEDAPLHLYPKDIQNLIHTFDNILLINRLDPQIFAIREQKIPLEKLGLDVREHWFDLEEAFGLQPSDYLNGLSFEAAEKIYWAFNNYALLQNLRTVELHSFRSN